MDVNFASIIEWPTAALATPALSLAASLDELLTRTVVALRDSGRTIADTRGADFTETHSYPDPDDPTEVRAWLLEMRETVSDVWVNLYAVAADGSTSSLQLRHVCQPPTVRAAAGRSKPRRFYDAERNRLVTVSPSVFAVWEGSSVADKTHLLAGPHVLPTPVHSDEELQEAYRAWMAQGEPA